MLKNLSVITLYFYVNRCIQVKINEKDKETFLLFVFSLILVALNDIIKL